MTTDADVRAATLALFDLPVEQQADGLADAVVRFGPDLIRTLDEISSGSPGDPRSIPDRDLRTRLTDQARTLLRDWLTGDRLTERADEGERRVIATRELLADEPDDPILTRVVLDAMLRLPAGHPSEMRLRRVMSSCTSSNGPGKMGTSMSGLWQNQVLSDLTRRPEEFIFTLEHGTGRGLVYKHSDDEAAKAEGPDESGS